MKKIYLFTLAIISLTSCNQGKIKDLESSIAQLKSENSELTYQVDSYSDQIDELEKKVEEYQSSSSSRRSTELELFECQYNYKAYRYGDGICITRYTNSQGTVTVCGAEKIIEFFGNHYKP